MTPKEFRFERTKRLHSQDTLALALGYSMRQVIRWEKGETPIPDTVAYRIRYEVPTWSSWKKSVKEDRS